MIVESSNSMDTIMASSNDITMLISITVMNGVVFLPMGVIISMVSLTYITIAGMVVRGGRMVIIIDITILGILLPTLINIIIRNKRERMIVKISNAMATIMKGSNAIAMRIVIPVTNGVVVQLMGLTLPMVILTAITMVELEVRGDRMVVLTDITILGISLSA